MVGAADKRALKAVYLGGGHGLAEHGIFAGGLHDAAPPGVAGDVDHGRKGPLNAGGASLLGGQCLRARHEVGIPGRRHGQGNRRDCPEAVNDVVAEDQRDVQPRLGDGDVLQLVDADGVGVKQKGADLSGAGELILLGNGDVHRLPGRLLGLADLLGEGHAREEILDEAVDIRV